jgi:hypothetical protein
MALLMRFFARAAPCERVHTPIGVVNEANHQIEKIARHIES